MIQRVVEQAENSHAISTTVATDDGRIIDHLNTLKFSTVMTSSSHESGSDRLEEATRLLDLELNDVVVNVQGDEPLIPPAVIDQVASLLFDHPECQIATLCEPILAGKTWRIRTS